MTFSVTASSSTTLSYQWKKNGTSISGATLSSYTIASVQATHAGTYMVKVSNSSGSVNSSNATLTVLYPPSITTQPGNQGIPQGQSGSFSVVVSGTAPFAYQWTFNGTAIPDATNASLALNNVQTNDAGGYRVVVTNNYGSVTSSMATLTVYVPPSVATQPQSLTVTQGQNASFSVGANGSTPMVYLWYFNGTSLVGAGTSPTLTLTNVGAAKAGNYTAVVTNAWGSVTSDVATLTVLIPAGIATQPANQAVVQGQNATFSVIATGDPTLTYQWSFNGAALPERTTASLTLNNVQPSDAGNYSVQVANDYGSVTSSIATLTVYIPPAITFQPQSLILTQAQTASFSVAASGSTPFSYQWYLNGASLGASNTASTLNLNNVGTNNAGNYTVIVTNPGGSVTSSVAILTVQVPAQIAVQPVNQAAVLGQNVAFSVSAFGDAPLSYQWNFNGAALPSATNAFLPLGAVQTNQAGNYTVLVANSVGSVTSSVASLTVYVPPYITTQPQSVTTTQALTATFSVAAGGTLTLSYQWYFNNVKMGAGSTSPTLSLTNVTTANSGNYTVVITNSYGAITSSIAALTVLVPAGILTQPTNQAVVLGQTASFSVVASGSVPINYQWNFNGAPVSGGTNATLTLSNVQTNQAGSYNVTLVNSAGSVTSAAAALTVYVPPTIATQPQSLTLTQAQTATFTVLGNGTPTLSYQWYFNGARLAGSTTTILSITNIGTNNVGSYTAVVTNSWGSVTSAVASLTVLVPAQIAVQPASQTVVQGQTATFSVSAYGDAPLTYQWNFNTSPISGATASSLVLTNAQTNQVGSYTVRVANSYGSTISSAATLTVYVPAYVGTPPQSLTVTQGQAASFSVVAGGTTPLSYQWYFNGSKLIGNTSTNLTVSNVGTNNAGGYTVVVTNLYGSATSAVAALTVRVPAQIAIQPANLAVVLGQTANFSVAAYGDLPLSYQWTFNGTNIAGATNSAFALPNAQTNQAGNYSVLVANSVGSTTSSNALLTVYVPPSITSQPQSLAVISGQNATFSVSAAGSTPYTYQWYFNGTSVGTSGQGSSYTVANAASGNAGGYTVIVSAPGGSVTSVVANLIVYVPPSISSQPSSLTVVQGQTGTFSVTAGGSIPLSYQWNVNGTNVTDGLYISGSTAPTLTLSNVQPTQAGNVFVVVTNNGGSVTSTVRTLTVNVPATVSNQPVSMTVTQGQTASFSVTAIGTPTLTYQWYLNAVSLGSGFKTPTISISNAGTNNAGVYAVIVNNSYGSATSAPVTLTVLVPAQIAIQPANQAVVLGQTGSFSVSAYGDVPLLYQWSFKGTNISGATNSSLSLPNAQTNQAGNYAVSITNAWGYVTSSNAAFTVYVPPSIITQPQNTAVTSGQTATFSVTPGGSPPFTYQWYLNGSSLGNGGVNQTLSINNAAPGDAGNYTVVVTGPGGSITSAPATLTVYVPPSIQNQPGSVTVVQGQTASFSVNASGSPPPSYQWNVNGTNVINGPYISGSTAATLTLSNVQPTQAGNVFVVLTNLGGSLTSAVRTLTVNVPATISNHPTSLTVTQGQTAAFSVTAIGTPTLTYQWYLNGVSLGNGFKTASISIPAAGTNNAGTYTVIVNNNYGSATSVPVTLTVLVPAQIAVQPVSQAVVQGQTANFSVAAYGDAPLRYQWSFNGTNLTGITSSSFSIPNAQTNQVGSYTVLISNAWGTVTSSPATLTVYVPPYIVTQPQSLTLTQAQTATFSILANGTPALAYQWYFNGAKLTGSTNTNLIITNVGTNNIGNYTAVVTNTWGAVTSTVVALTVRVPAQIAIQPTSQAVVQGQTANFSVAAFGDSPLNYQWYFNGSRLGGGNKSSLSLANAQTNQVGNYTVIVDNAWGSVTSSVASLTVYVPPYIATQPQSLTLTQAQTATFSVLAGGTPALAYQWYFNGTRLTASTSTNLIVSNVGTNNIGNYTVVVTNTWGMVTSSVAALTVRVPAQIATQPTNQAVVQGQTASFSVAAFGDAPLTYQWNFNGSPLANATSSSLSFSNAQTNQVGNYHVIVGNAWGSVTSSVVSLTVYVPPYIAAQPQSLTLTQSQTATFSVVAGGTPTLAYQWYFNGAKLIGSTSTNLVASNVGTNNVGSYTVVVTNTWGMVTSAVASLTVRVPAQIAIQPTNQAVVQGQTANFSVAAFGDAPLTYQWNFNGSPLANATSSSLSFSNAQTNQVGNYNVIVGNAWGSATSSVAALTLYVPPSIIANPQSMIITQGQTGSFSVGANGTSPLSYKWNFNGAALPGATNATLTIGNAQPSSAGNYSAVVTNSWGSATSAVASLTVRVPASIVTQPSNQVVAQGQTATFSVLASGDAPITYQWSFNGTPIAGATNASLALLNAQPSNAGNYYVTVANPVASVTSQTKTLTVNIPAAITSQPQSLSVVQGQTASLQVVASGTPTLTYQWYFNGLSLGASATDSKLLLNNIGTNNAGSYTVVVTNSVASVTSAAATVSVSVPASRPNTLWLSTQGPSLGAGASPVAWSTNHVVSFDAPALSYGYSNTYGTFRIEFGFQPPHPIRELYFVNSTNRIGNPGSDFELWPGDLLVVFNLTTPTTVGGVTNVMRDDVLLYRPGAGRNYTNGVFSMLLDNPLYDGGVLNVHALTLVERDTVLGNTLIPRGTFLVARPDSTKHMNVYTYRPTSVGRGTTSQTPLQLLIDGNKLGNTNQMVQGLALIETPLTMGNSNLNAGTILMSVNGTATLNPGTQNLTVQPADIFSLNVTATEQDTVPNTIATASIFFNGINVGLDTGNPNENLVSLALVDWANLTPVITTQPVNQHSSVGTNIIFSVTANTGSSGSSYQWNLNGAAILGGTSPTLQLNNVQTNDAGSYTVVIANLWGSTTSAVAILTLDVPPQITAQPQSQALAIGQTATFTVGVAGTAPLMCQWRFNGSALAGATGPALLINNLHNSNAGNYSVTITNSSGSITSSAATLTLTNPVITLTAARSPTMATDGFNFKMSIPMGITYVIWASPDCSTWTPIYTNTADTETIVIVDPSATNYVRRFYRATLP